MRGAKILIAVFCVTLMIAASFICLTSVDIQYDDGLGEKEKCGTSCDNSSETDFWVGKLEYRVTGDKTVKVIDYKGSKVCNLFVPDTVEFETKVYTVNEIGEKALTSESPFARFPSTVSIGPNVEKIDDMAMDYSLAWWGKNHLNSFEIRDVEHSKLKEIGDSAFECTNIDSIVLPASLEKIGYKAFRDNNKLTDVTRIVDPEHSSTTLSIGGCAFYDCEKLSNVDIRGKVTMDGEDAFSHNPLLSTVNLPNVTSVGDCAFEECKNLTSVNVSTATSVGVNAFRNCRSLETIDISAATSVGDHAFHDCKKLHTVNMSSAVTIGKCAFESCKKLQTVDMSNVTTLGMYVFKNCDSLQTVDMPEVVEIGEYAFSYCDNLHTIHMPKVKDIGKDAFTGSKKITELTISDCLEKIGKNAFKHTSFFDIDGKEMKKTVEMLQGHTFIGVNGKLRML